MSYTLRINPVAPYDGPGMERWLERLAAQGLFPGRIGDGFCWLRKGEPTTRRYRLAPMGSRKDPDLEVRKDLYHEAGWDYAGTWSVFHLFYAEDPAAPEPYSDGESRLAALDSLDRVLKRANTRIAVVHGFVLLLLLWAIVLCPELLPMFLLMELPVTALVWVVWADVHGVLGRRKLRALRETLAQGGTPVPDKPQPRRNAAFAVLGALALLGLIGGWLVQRESFPRAEVPGLPSVTAMETTYPCRVDEKDTQRLGFTLFVPYQVRTEEDGISGYRPPEDRRLSTLNGYYHPGLDSVTLHVTLPFLTETVARAQREMDRIQNLAWREERLDCPGADFAILWESGEQFQMLALGKGGKAVVYRYRGVEDLRDHLEPLMGPIQ